MIFSFKTVLHTLLLFVFEAFKKQTQPQTLLWDCVCPAVYYTIPRTVREL